MPNSSDTHLQISDTPQDAAGRSPSSLHSPRPVLAAGAELARHWDLSILGPIRAARRALKAQLPPVEDGARLALREEVKRIELATEHLLMDSLESLAPGPRTGNPAAALVRAGRAWGGPPPDAALQSLADRLA